MNNQGQRILEKIKKEFLKACKDNLHLTKKIKITEEKYFNSIKEKNNLFIEVYQIELEVLIIEYMRNAKIVAQGMLTLGLIEQNFICN
jgi:preprotein translocase subunit Sss1